MPMNPNRVHGFWWSVPTPRRWTALLALLATLPSCVAQVKPTPSEQLARAPHPTALAIFDAASCARLAWSEVLDRVAKADAVFVGETHDDATAHTVEHALVESFIASHERPALSLEFLERDDQGFTDAYLRGEISVDDFVTKTKSRDWAGEGTWMPWYQPMIDSAKRAKAPVVAANAPRPYVTRARTEGYDPLCALGPEERSQFEVDEAISRDGDWERLKALIIEMRSDGAHGAAINTGDLVSDDEVDSFHRAQRVWDRTMGLSAARAQNSGYKVIHCVGAFHIGERLGTVAQFAMQCPNLSILVVDLVPSAAITIAPEDFNGADIVIHTKSAR